MALNKLKKWIGTQAMTAFFDQLNDNVDATNAAIDLAETDSATIASLLGGGDEYTLTLLNGWGGNLYVRRNVLGQVTIYGVLTAGVVDSGTLIAELPVDCKPLAVTAVVAHTSITAIRSTLGLYLLTNGEFRVDKPASDVLSNGSTLRVNCIYQSAIS